MKVFITAVNGFLGGHLSSRLMQDGHIVSGSVRDLNRGPSLQNDNLELTRHSLEDIMDPVRLLGRDVIIHCAHDFTGDVEDSFRINIEGTKSVFNAAKNAGVGHQIFISSYSSHPKATSTYGKVKYQLEQFFLEQGQTIVRPGLVVGDGGLFLRYIKKIIQTPVMPMLDGGSDPLALIPLDDFNSGMLEIIGRKSRGQFNLFIPKPITMREFIELINRIAHHKCFYINIPLNVALALTSVLVKLKIPLPFKIENIKGLKNNNACTYDSHLNLLVKESTRLEIAIEKVLSALSSRKGSRSRV